MKCVSLHADWKPRKDFVLGGKDVDGKLSYLGSRVWCNPRVVLEEKPTPQVGPRQVLIEVKACGICGSDVHMAQADDQGYIWYPGLTAFPCTLGHEFSGVVIDSGSEARNRRTGKPYQKGEPVCCEEMAWCGVCKPCADGFPNHCEALQEIGFSIDGAYAKYVVADAAYCWSLKSLEKNYPGDKLFLAGSLVEPTSVAYNAVIVRGGGIRPGENVLILGGGPIGVAACAILRRAGAAHVILSEPSEGRARLAKTLGATDIINPAKEDLAKRVLEITEGQGAKLILEATGLPDVVWPGLEQVIWEGRGVNTTVVIVARADKKIPLTGEVFQVRRANIVGAQGHSGHGTFANVIAAMATGMDMTPMITKQISLEQVPEHLKLLQTDRDNCKITMLP